jgi:hypothetical protein
MEAGRHSRSALFLCVSTNTREAAFLNVVEVARQAGHSLKMALDTYAHVFEEFEPAERIDAPDRIRQAREELRLRARQPDALRRRLTMTSPGGRGAVGWPERSNAYDAANVLLAQELGAESWTLGGPLAGNASGRGLPVQLIPPE